MSKLIYAKSKAGFLTAFPNYATTTDDGYKGITFTEDGYLCTHGIFFRIFPDAATIFTSTVTNGVATLVDSGSKTLGTINVGVTAVAGGNLITTTAISNGSITVNHNAVSAGFGAAVGGAATSASVVVPSFTVDDYGHITVKGSSTATLDSVLGSVSTSGAGATFYLLGQSASTASTASAYKISSVYADYQGNLTANKFIGALNYTLSLNLNNTAQTFNNTAATTVASFYAPTSSGTTSDGTYLSPTSSGAPVWIAADTTPTSGSAKLLTSGGAFSAINGAVSTANAMVYKGTLNGTSSGLPAAEMGDTYKISVAGTFNGTKTVEVGDMIICNTDSTAAVAYASIVAGSWANWDVIQGNIDGAVTGPTSSTVNNFALFNNTTGTVIKDSGFAATTVGQSLIQLANPGASTYIRISSGNVASTISATTLKSDLSLGNVENTALSTWAGTANITTLGTIATGTWNATNISLGKGGTNASLTASAGAIVYSTASAFALSAVGSLNQVLISGATGAPTWTNQSSLSVGSAGSATNLAAGAQGSIPYQTAVGTTAFLAASGTNGYVLKFNTTTHAPEWLADTNTDTHYITHLYIGATGAASSAATANGATYLKLYDDSTARESFKISGAGATTVTSDASGNLTITSANTWRNVTAYSIGATSTIGEVLSTSIGTADLQFGNEFVWDTVGDGTNGPELKLGWAEVTALGVVSYSV